MLIRFVARRYGARCSSVFDANPYAVPLYSLPMIYAKQKNVVWEPGTQGSLDLSARGLSFK